MFLGQSNEFGEAGGKTHPNSWCLTDTQTFSCIYFYWVFFPFFCKAKKKALCCCTEQKETQENMTSGTNVYSLSQIYKWSKLQCEKVRKCSGVSAKHKQIVEVCSVCPSCTHTEIPTTHKYTNTRWNFVTQHRSAQCMRPWLKRKLSRKTTNQLQQP